jgi:hypothetical protein
MRHTTGFLAFLLFLTAPLAAQEAPPPVPDGNLAAVEALVERAATEAPADPEVLEERKAPLSAPASAGVSGAEVEIEIQGTLELVRMDAPTETLEMRQPDRRGWWWMVAAIVTAGVILAVVL